MKPWERRTIPATRSCSGAGRPAKKVSKAAPWACRTSQPDRRSTIRPMMHLRRVLPREAKCTWKMHGRFPPSRRWTRHRAMPKTRARRSRPPSSMVATCSTWTCEEMESMISRSTAETPPRTDRPGPTWTILGRSTADVAMVSSQEGGGRPLLQRMKPLQQRGRDGQRGNHQAGAQPGIAGEGAPCVPPSRPAAPVQQRPPGPPQFLVVLELGHPALDNDPVLGGGRTFRRPLESGDERLLERLHLGGITGQRVFPDPVTAQRGVDEPDVAVLDEPQPDHDRLIDVGIVIGVAADLLPGVPADDTGVVRNDAGQGVGEGQRLTGVPRLPLRAHRSEIAGGQVSLLAVEELNGVAADRVDTGLGRHNLGHT